MKIYYYIPLKVDTESLGALGQTQILYDSEFNTGDNSSR